MEKGRPLEVEEKDGGSIRRKGEEEARRFLERRPIRLCFGEPRLAEIGVVVVVVGTERESGLFTGNDTELSEEFVFEDSVVRMNLGLAGMASKFFERLEGELKITGSMFSPSELWSSSKEAAVKVRFPGEARGCFMEGEEGFVRARQ